VGWFAKTYFDLRSKPTPLWRGSPESVAKPIGSVAGHEFSI
jgi:hypothetical protein